MSKPKTPSLPATPQYYTDPLYAQGQQTLSGLGNDLTSFNFQGGLSPLQDAISFDPEITKLALNSTQDLLTPEYQRTRQNTVNDLANLGALNSSTTANAFLQQDQNLNTQLQGITMQAAMQDRTNALQNRIGLFGTGLNTLSGVTNSAQQNQGDINQFNLANYQNQVAKTLSEQKAQTGGWLGGLTGAIGGGLSGFAIGGPVGAVIGAGIGGYSGATSSPGTGGGFLQSGAGMYGSMPGVNRIAGLTNLPGAYASNSGLIGSMGSSGNLYDKLFSAGGLGLN